MESMESMRTPCITIVLHYTVMVLCNAYKGCHAPYVLSVCSSPYIRNGRAQEMQDVETSVHRCGDMVITS